MAFNVKKFEEAEFRDRTKAVPVPDLKEWFDEGDDPAITVKGLSGAEWFRVQEAAAKNKNLNGLFESIVSSDSTEKIQGIRESLGLLDELTPGELAKRIEMLKLGSVDPEFNHIAAAKLFESYPIEGITLTNEISRLTGQGKTSGESTPSGAEQTSETV